MARRALVMVAASVTVLTGGGATEAKPRPLPDGRLAPGHEPVSGSITLPSRSGAVLLERRP